jgi:FtsP/CotA-like multicopper oxidase with cupredoxin domain
MTPRASAVAGASRARRKRGTGKVLAWLASFVAIGAFLVAAGIYVLYTRADTTNVGELSFRKELRIPPLAEPTLSEPGRKVFDLTLEVGRTEFLPGKLTETWGANGTYLAPTLRAARGNEVLVNVENGLAGETTTLHWHGMHLPAAADGGPHQTIPPGETWSPAWTIDQPAATLWYHPHPHGATEDHVYRGIVGMFILDDLNTAQLGLPDEYGVDDIPLIVQDKRFEDDGSLDFSKELFSPTGLLGDEILVNGTHDPYLEVSTELVRLRLLNASNARVYNIGFADGRPFQLIATDGGLLEAPVRLDRIQLSPCERAEMVAQFEPGEEVVLRSFEPELGTNFFEGRFSGADDSFDLLEIRAAGGLASSPQLPARLAAIESPDEADASGVRRFELSGQSLINGQEMDMTRIDQAVELGATEIWEVENRSGTPHSFHIHDVRFRVLEYAGAEPPPQLAASSAVGGGGGAGLCGGIGVVGHVWRGEAGVCCGNCDGMWSAVPSDGGSSVVATCSSRKPRSGGESARTRTCRWWRATATSPAGCASALWQTSAARRR